MLLAVAIAVALGIDAGHEERLSGGTLGELGRVDFEGGREGALRTQGKGLALLHEHALGLGINEDEADGTTLAVVRSVGEDGREGGVVALTQEARHVGLHHDGLGGNGLSGDDAVVHQRVVGQTEEAPCGDTLWKREGDIDIALGVGGQGRIIESCLVEVLTQLATGVTTALESLCGLVGIADNDFLVA